jgi:hypothetical protein
MKLTTQGKLLKLARWVATLGKGYCLIQQGKRQVNGSIRRLLRHWIERRITDEAREWLLARLSEASDWSPTDNPTSQFGVTRAFDVAYARIPRVLGRAPLALTSDDLAVAETTRPGWTPHAWSVDGAARVLMLLHFFRELDHRMFAALFCRFRQISDPSEQAALFLGLPLYPASKELECEASEGLRTNIPSVFEAIAHFNPYPREVFDQHHWNHMVLKALFIGSALDPIQGLDERANPELALMSRDYARERRAAGRAIPSELWRCLARHAVEVDALNDLKIAMASECPVERNAATMAFGTAIAERSTY